MFQFPAPLAAGEVPAPADFAPPRPLPAGRDDPRVEIRLGIAVAAVFALTTAAWAVWMPLDAAVIASGTVRLLGNRQTVQGAGEGVIAAIRVGDGDHVRAGQPLVEFAAPDLVATERSHAARVISLQAEIARLQAGLAGTPLAAPAAFAQYRGDDAALATAALAVERRSLAERRAAVAAGRSVLAHRLEEVTHQLGGAAVQTEAVAKQRTLLGQEVDSYRTLAARGFASRNRVLEMERTEAELAGSSGSLAADAARLRVSAGETRMQMVQAEEERRQADAARLRDAQAELQMLLPQWAGARAQLARLELRAPVAGTVTALAVHTVGGVIERGQTVMEIVPDDRSLTVEAEVAAADGNEVAPGRPATLRLPGLHGRNIPRITGHIATVSADTEVDQKTGRGFYKVIVKVAPAELDRFSAAVGRAGVMRPGNPVDVTFPTRSRSALGYWMEPLTQAMDGGMHER